MFTVLSKSCEHLYIQVLGQENEMLDKGIYKNIFLKIEVQEVIKKGG